MLVCVSCNIEYKEDKKFCSYCGGPLVMKEDLTPSQKNMDKKEEEKSSQELICPHCEIIYEFGSSCIQCGSALVTKIPTKKKETLETDDRKPRDERELIQVKEYQEQQIKEPHNQLICPTCKFIYEHGNSCVKCGTALIAQTPTQTNEEPKIARKPEIEEKPIQLQTFQEQLTEVVHKKLICPTCKIIYERGNSCVRCGSALVAEIPSQEVEKPKLPDTPEVKKKEPETIQSPEAEQEPQEIKEEPPGTETTEQQPMKRSADDFESRLIRPRKRKINYRRLSLEVGSITIMVVAGGYFLWSIYSYMGIKEPGAKTPPSKEVSGPALSGSSIPTNTTANVSIPQETNRRETEHSSVISKEKTEVVPPAPSNLLPSDAVIEETLEIGKIKGLLENIRQANLQKNIDLFISCYATDFKDREGKKKATLAYWKKFDYLDLSYNLKNPSISSDTVKARVEWLIKISPKTGSQPQESKTILDVTLKKEEGGWKIKEVKQAG